MLRLYIVLLLQAAYFLPACAQKEDNAWIFGYDYNPGDGLAEGIYFSFNDSLEISYKQRPMSFFNSSASICDSTGNLLIYSNGCYVEKGDGVEVENSEGLNPGTFYDNCEDNDGYNLPHNMVLLPYPGYHDRYALFHLPGTFNAGYGYYYAIMNSCFDMSANSGNGTTLYKNQVITQDTLHGDGIHAVRHANGRDWWVVVAKLSSNLYYKILLSPADISLTQQSIGEPTGSGAAGQMVFSPDGTKLARFNARDDLRIFDFDRCTGTLSNPVFVPMQNGADIEIFSGMSWSADSRFIYAAENTRLLQFDTWAPDIAGSMTVVATADPPVCPLSGSIGFMELGPDGIIYCRPYNGQNCMHRMKHPERAGVSCDFQQNYFQLDFPYANLAHFPNFRLGPVDGSACDTLGIDNHPLGGWRYDRTGDLGVDFTSVSWYEPTEWLWDFGDPASGGANASTERNPSHTFSAPGAYQVCLTVSNQYGSDEKCRTVWVSTTGSSSPQEALEEVHVFPNPTTGEVHYSGIPDGAEVTARVYNSLGELVLEQETSGLSLRLHQLLPGLYYLQLQLDRGHIIIVKMSLLSK